MDGLSPPQGHVLRNRLQAGQDQGDTDLGLRCRLRARVDQREMDLRSSSSPGSARSTSTAPPRGVALLGRSAWWLPRRLDQILPDLDVEGARLGTPPRPARQEPAAVGR